MLLAQPTWALKVPPPPSHYVLDEPGVIDTESKNELSRIAAEQERLTGDQIIVAVFRSIEDEDLVDYTNRVFKEWKIGQSKKNNGVLLALFWKEHKIRIEVGYGLEPLLTDARSKQIISDVLAPELRAQNTGPGLLLAFREILKTIESPLVKDGTDLFKTPVRSARPHRTKRATTSFPLIVLFVVLVLLIRFLDQITSRDAVFNRRGRSRYYSGGYWGGGFGGGGFSGGSSGGGGFSGGGGMSGGGGASGDW